jgi:hypothetical protein
MRLQLRRLEDIWIAVQTPSRLADAVERTEGGKRGGNGIYPGNGYRIYRVALEVRNPPI